MRSLAQIFLTAGATALVPMIGLIIRPSGQRSVVVWIDRGGLGYFVLADGAGFIMTAFRGTGRGFGHDP